MTNAKQICITRLTDNVQLILNFGKDSICNRLIKINGYARDFNPKNVMVVYIVGAMRNQSIFSIEYLLEYL